MKVDQLIAQQVQLLDDELWIDDRCINLTPFRRAIIVGAGKAAAAMAIATQRVISRRLPTCGWVNVPEQSFEPADVADSPVTIWPARPTGCNEPTAAAVQGTRQILDLVQSATAQDLVIVTLTGGGSALLCSPCAGVSLEDKIAVTRWLSSRGANIQELNAVRRHLSDVKGGGLKRACRAGHLITIVLSDVLGDPLDVIASGPTVDSPEGSLDPLAILAQYDPEYRLPESIYRAIKRVRSHEASAAHVLKHDEVIVGNLATAVDAAGIHAESLGYSHAMFVARQSEGAAEAVGRHLAEMAYSMLQGDPRSPDCLISGGEPTVQLAAPDVRGIGGRNQHLVLAALVRLQELQLSPAAWRQLVIMSAGTDGEDGPTDAAGAMLKADVWQRACELKLDAYDYLRRSDSYHFFQQTGGLYLTGPTHTNVCDLRVLVVDRDDRLRSLPR